MCLQMHLELNIEKKMRHIKYWKFGCEYGVEKKSFKKNKK